MDWRRIRVAPERTHHVVDGAAAYSRRFREVLSFHEPGLAAALADDGTAFHIRPDGQPAYAQRFQRTFGFYEMLAAAATTAEGWLHIDPDGLPAYRQRWEWCGNFQEDRCPVRIWSGAMFHIDRRGAPTYADRWSYAGDFREGTAVVIRAEGDASHITPDGRFLHGRWLAELDVFHKGFARARDERGWHHVDRSGRAAYTMRFDSIENFYNGLALAIRDQKRVIVNERGEIVTTL